MNKVYFSKVSDPEKWPAWVKSEFYWKGIPTGIYWMTEKKTADSKAD